MGKGGIAVAASTSVYQTVKGVMDAAGIPEHIWGPIMDAESGGDPSARNQKGENSWGLFQINTDANPQFADLDLLDPEINAQVAATHFLAPAYRQVKDIEDPAFQTEYVWREGIRPLWNNDQAAKIQRLFAEWWNGDYTPSKEPMGASIHDWTDEPDKRGTVEKVQDWAEGVIQSKIVTPAATISMYVVLIAVAGLAAYMVFRPDVAGFVKNAVKDGASQ
jgi:hypothetical protein